MAGREEHDHRTEAAKRPRLNQKLRSVFIAGAEDRSRAERGRGLTEAELERVLKLYPGDVPAR